MIGFAIFQILFDAVLFFTILFLFHFSVQRIYKKREESDLIKNAQALEIQDNLQKMLTTLKSLGEEISEDIQGKIGLADEKANKFRGLLLKLEKDLARATTLAEKIEMEKGRLEEKFNNIKMPQREGAGPLSLGRVSVLAKSHALPPGPAGSVKLVEKYSAIEERGIGGISPELVDEIYKLADKSCSVNTIVRKTNLTPAEVQLILNLRGNRSAAVG